jgi:single-stranded-DNA-specific exonuclease
MSLDNILNRTIIRTGIIEINSFRNPVWRAIADVLNIEHFITARDIGYTIGPYINAANRTNVESIAYRLLNSATYEEALVYAEELFMRNTERKKEQFRLVNSLKEQIANATTSYSLTVTMSTELGINGTIASIVGESIKLPTICFVDDNSGELKGSGRGILPNIDLIKIFNYIKATDDSIIIKSGGHHLAAGVTIHKDKLSDFITLFDLGAKIQIEDDNIEQIEQPTIVVPVRDITPQLAYDVELAAPYGKDWIEPIFKVTSTLLAVIPISNGLKITIGNSKKESVTMFYFYNQDDGINVDNYSSLLQIGSIISIIFTVHIGTYRVPVFKVTAKSILTHKDF